MAGVVPDDEPLADLLRRKERELSQQIAALRGALAPKQRELEAVHKAMEALGLYADVLTSLIHPPEQIPNVLEMSNGVVAGTVLGVVAAHPEQAAPVNFDANAMFTLAQQGRSIKDLILSALRDHFRSGATPAELRDYFKNAYGREIDRNSISPTLARLRDQGAVEQSSGVADPKWKLTRAGKWYDHPSSFDIPTNNGLYHGDGEPPPLQSPKTRLNDLK